MMLVGYSSLTLADGLGKMLQPYENWKKRFQQYQKNGKEMRGVVFVSGGVIEKLDCKNLMMVIRPRIGGRCIVEFMSIQDVRIYNTAAVPNFCAKSEWLSVGKRIDVKGRFKYIKRRNIIYKADISPFVSDFFDN